MARVAARLDAITGTAQVRVVDAVRPGSSVLLAGRKAETSLVWPTCWVWPGAMRGSSASTSHRVHGLTLRGPVHALSPAPCLPRHLRDDAAALEVRVHVVSALSCRLRFEGREGDGRRPRSRMRATPGPGTSVLGLSVQRRRATRLEVRRATLRDANTCCSSRRSWACEVRWSGKRFRGCAARLPPRARPDRSRRGRAG